jgi:hypothetical protein
MTERRGRWPMMATLAAGLTAAAACSPLPGAEVGLPYPGSASATVLSGEIAAVDTRRGRIQLRDEWGRSQTLRYDRRTSVVYRQRQYPVTALERGDRVRVRVVQDRNRNAWAERVEVRESVRDRRPATGRPAANRVERVEGTAGIINRQRGFFTVERPRMESLVVHLPSGMGRDDARRLERLRRGDRVRVEVRHRGLNQADLVRFR